MMPPCRQPRFLRVSLHVFLSVLLLLSSMPMASAQKAAPAADLLVQMNQAVDALTKKVWPSVVQILVSS